MANAQAPILVKKKMHHAGHHHGGAWKVAYADFVTAMMALFIVLWLMSSTTKQQQLAISGYFRDPKGVAAQKGHVDPGVGTGENILLNKQDMTKLKTTLQNSIHRVDNLDRLKNQVEMTITPEGLRIELIENAHGTFFETGSTRPTPVLVEILRVLSPQLGALPNHISIEGHTDSQPYSDARVYSNWELSSDRANAARRLMQTSGVRMNQVSQVRGFADQRLRDAGNPLSASNRRVSLIVQYLEGGKQGALPSLTGIAGSSPPGSKPGAAPALTGREVPGAQKAAGE